MYPKPDSIYLRVYFCRDTMVQGIALHYNRVYTGYILGLYGDNGKENANYRDYRAI